MPQVPSYWDNAASYNLASNLSSLLKPRKLTTPVDFGTQHSPCRATHVGFLPTLPPVFSLAFWGPGFKYNLYSLGYLLRRGGSYSTDPATFTHPPSLRIYDTHGRLIDHPTLSSSNLLPARPQHPNPASLAAATPPLQPNKPQPPPALQLPHPPALSQKYADVEALHLLYNHASDSTLSSGIQSGLIPTKVTPQDITAYRKASGPCVSCIEGKLRDRPHPPYPNPRGTHPGSDLYIDIHDLPAPSPGGSTTSIRCVDGFTSKLDIQGAIKKTSREILLAILTIVATAYNAFNHTVDRIWTDSEPVFKSLRASLGLFGIALQLFTPLDHNRFFERYNQTLETWAASTRASLAYILPPQYDLQLAADIATKLNALPNHRTGPHSCPYTLVTRLNPPTPKGTFGLIYMVDSSDQQRTITAQHLGLGVKATDKAIPAIHMGHNTLWPSAPQFLLPTGRIVTRVPRSPPLPLIPTRFQPKQTEYTSLSTLPPLAPPLPADIALLHPPASPALRPQPTLNSLVQPGPLPHTLDILLPAPKNSTPACLPLDFPPPSTPRVPPSPHIPPFPAGPPPSPLLSPTPTSPPTSPVSTIRPHPHPPPLPPLACKGNTRSSSLRPGATAASALIALALAALLSPTRLTAVTRKAALKQEAMTKARTYYQSLTLPPGTTNSPSSFLPAHFELDPPLMAPDEITLHKALSISASPTADPALRKKIDDAVALELTKVTTRFDTLRAITASNPMEPNAWTISSLMFIKFKRDGRVTARLAGCGNQQKTGSYSSTYASTSDHSTHTLITAAYYAHAIKTKTLPTLIHADFDVPGAFLQERLPRSATGGRQLCLKLPANLPHPLAGQWCEVVGAIYGLKQSNAIFEAGFRATMALAGFHPAYAPQHPASSAPDTAIYHYSDPSNPSLKCTVPMHVDDGQVFSTSSAIVDRLRTTLEARYGPLTWNDVSTQFTGTIMTRHPSGAIDFDMHKHILKTILKVGASHLPGAPTPCDPNIFLSSPDTTPTDKAQYQSIVGDLTYISRNRHDITKPVHVHARKTQNPTIGDLRKVIRTLRYLKAFPELAARYHTEEGAVLYGHVDASHANQEDGTSTTGVHGTIGSTSAPFFSKVLRQSHVALDPCTAEYYGLTPTAKLMLRYRHLLEAIGFPQHGPTTIFVDNLPALAIAIASNIPTRSRYIHAEHHFIRQCIADKIISLRQRNTNYHSPDLHTKAHGPTSHHFLTSILMNTRAPTTPVL